MLVDHRFDMGRRPGLSIWLSFQARGKNLLELEDLLVGRDAPVYEALLCINERDLRLCEVKRQRNTP